jgi:hypothetical protein
MKNSIEWKGDTWMMNWKGFWMKQSWPNFKVLSRHSSGETEENHESSVRIGGLQATIWTWNLPNTKQ